MGIIRQFSVSCDKCFGETDETMWTATQVRERCKKEGWTISGNKFTCPFCNGRDPDYPSPNAHKSDDDAVVLNLNRD